MSAVQFQRQLGLTRYETAFQILHKLRAGMVRTSGRIGLRHDHVEIDETWVGGETRGEGRGVHHQTCVIAAVEVRQRVTKPEREDRHEQGQAPARRALRRPAAPRRGPGPHG